MNEYDSKLLPHLLPLYYKRLFPHKSFYRWLSYKNSENNSIFSHRELSFTLNDDIYIRYLSFENETELEKEICTKAPFKIDIGAVMSARPKDHRNSHIIIPVQRELVFDIDMTDYDEVRTCCKGADVCQKCWKFMSLACRILDTALRDDFGFENILWVFSGRRGIHCWVCDKSARLLDSKGRSGVAEYLQLVMSSGENNVSRVIIGEKKHHSVKRALEIIEPMFEEICLNDQNLFGGPNGISKLLMMVPDESLRKEVELYLNKFERNSKEIWNAFVDYLSKKRGNRKLKYLIEEIQLALLYPRLDINVTKGFNHLLKAPFCVHPKTGKICIPFNPSAVSKFDLTSVPTINSLLEEINAFDDKNKTDDLKEEKSKIKDYKKTGMFKGVVVFEEFLRKLESSCQTKSIGKSEMNLEF